MMKIRRLSYIKKSWMTLILCLVLMHWQIPQSQAEPLSADNEITLIEAIKLISQEYQVLFNYDRVWVSDVKVNYDLKSAKGLEEDLAYVMGQTDLKYRIFDQRYVALYRDNEAGLASMQKMVDHLQGILDEKNEVRGKRVHGPVKYLQTYTSQEFYNKRLVLTVNGTVTDQEGELLIGVNIQVKGTNKGTATDFDGGFVLEDIDENAVLVVSYIGYQTKEVMVAGKSTLSISLILDSQLLDEVVVVGYGTMKKSDLTGSVVRADIGFFQESPNVSIIQSMQGSIPGLNIEPINRSGQNSQIQIRGRSSLSGELDPLIVVDNIIFRGSLIDLNPRDIESIDILKDASSAAIYGSQASNGVMLITTKRGGGMEGKPEISYSGYYSFQSPIKELRPPGLMGFYKQTEEADIFRSRTEESGYFEKNPNWDITSTFSTNEEKVAYENGRSSDWYNLLTSDNIYTHNQNISIANRTKYSNYYISLGFTDQNGYMLNEDYSRMNARINIGTTVTDWLQTGIQTFLTIGDYGFAADPGDRYLSPYTTVYNETGEYQQIVAASTINPFIRLEADELDKRLNLSGNIYALVDIPFINGLSYKLNISNNYRPTSRYYFRPYSNNFQGGGAKKESINYDFTLDNIISLKRNINDIHKIDVTLLYGLERRNFTSTEARSRNFITSELGYNSLQEGDRDLQAVTTTAWEESSLYNMGRLFYGYDNKYLFTGTIRRDGFSGFSEENKFGLFPSISAAWVISEESFFNNDRFFWELLKLRISYGSTGNRTIGRYQTLARLETGYNYITTEGEPIYTKYVTSIASPNLKWETTTGINVGIDFGFSNIINGSIDYYDNYTTNLLYDVDVPGISRFVKFPDNLGKLKNNGLEITLSTQNLIKQEVEWSNTFVFSRNRDKLEKLLGFDLDGDMKEDDLISEGLFIGESLNAIYTYKTDGIYQLNDEIPLGFDIGGYKIVDLNNDGIFSPVDDRTIIGNRSPSYNFGISNNIRYRNWTLKFFINSIQGGNKYYMAADRLEGFSTGAGGLHFRYIFPDGIDMWTPESPNERYEKVELRSSGPSGTLYSQRNFVRLQDITLSWVIPNGLLERLSLNNLKLYFSGKNIVTLTKWNGWDPETGQSISRDGLPVLKSFTLGLNVDF